MVRKDHDAGYIMEKSPAQRTRSSSSRGGEKRKEGYIIHAFTSTPSSLLHTRILSPTKMHYAVVVCRLNLQAFSLMCPPPEIVDENPEHGAAMSETKRTTRLRKRARPPPYEREQSRAREEYLNVNSVLRLTSDFSFSLLRMSGFKGLKLTKNATNGVSERQFSSSKTTQQACYADRNLKSVGRMRWPGLLARLETNHERFSSLGIKLASFRSDGGRKVRCGTREFECSELRSMSPNEP